MSKFKFFSLTAIALSAAILGSGSASASTVIDVGTIAEIGTSFPGTFSSTATSPVYADFIVGSPSDVNLTFTVKDKNSGALSTSSTLQLFSCLSNCNTTTVPVTGTLIDTANLSPQFGLGSTAFQVAIFDDLLKTGNYVAVFTTSTPTTDAYSGDFTVSAVPEPSTWAMLILGFAAIGFAGLRKSRKAAGLAAA